MQCRLSKREKKGVYGYACYVDADSLGNTIQLERFLAVAGSLALPQSMTVAIMRTEAPTRPKFSVTKLLPRLPWPSLPRVVLAEVDDEIASAVAAKLGMLDLSSVKITGKMTTHAV